MSTKSNRPGIDTWCEDLADHFLRDVKGSTYLQKQELAEQIQRICEDFCGDIERAYAARLRK